MIRLSELAAIRRRRLLSQEELAQRSGVSKNTIHRLETGTSLAQGRTARRLAEALGVEPEALFEEGESQDLKIAA